MTTSMPPPGPPSNGGYGPTQGGQPSSQAPFPPPGTGPAPSQPLPQQPPPPQQQPPQQQPPPQQPPPSKGKGKWIALGCGGCALIVIIVAAVLLIVWRMSDGHGRSDTASAPSTEVTSAESTQQEESEEPATEETSAPEEVEDELSEEPTPAEDDSTTDEKEPSGEPADDEPGEDDPSAEGEPADEDTVTVTYEMEADGSKADVTYIDPGFGIADERGQKSGWSKDMEFAEDMADGAGMYAHLTDRGTVTCRVLIDGEVVLEETQKGERAIADCVPEPEF